MNSNYILILYIYIHIYTIVHIYTFIHKTKTFFIYIFFYRNSIANKYITKYEKKKNVIVKLKKKVWRTE